MGTSVEERNEIKQGKTRRGAVLLAVLLIIVIILLLLSFVMLGARLFEMTTRDRYAVDIGMETDDGGPRELELFRIRYRNDAGEITVEGVDRDKVVAPGTEVDYDVRLRNSDEVVVDFVMVPEVEYLTDDPVPVRFKIMDTYGNYIAGSEDTWADALALNDLAHKGAVHPGEVFTYHITWQWAFEGDDEYDTYLGNITGDELPGISVKLTTESTANPSAPKSNNHWMHLFGEGFGCCWCCWLVWILLIIIALLLIWIWRLRSKLRKLEDRLEEQEQLLSYGAAAVAADMAAPLE